MGCRSGSVTSGGIFDVVGRTKHIEELEKLTTEPGFWDRANEAQSVLRDLKLEKSWVESYHDVNGRREDLQVLAELAHEEGDAGRRDRGPAGPGGARGAARALEIRSLFRDEADARAAILTIHPGAGGIDSQDWAEMLFRMYLRWADRRGFEVEIVDQQPGEEAGIKSASVIVRGDYAYGYLKVERGVHRLVRISPFDAQKRRHTSFASVDVWAGGRRGDGDRDRRHRSALGHVPRVGGRAGSTSTRRTPRCGSRTSPRGSW